MKKRNGVVVGVFISFIAAGFATYIFSSPSPVASEQSDFSFKTIDVQEGKNLLELRNNKKSDVLFIDVRTLEEHHENNIPGSLLVPLDQLDAFWEDLDQYKDVPKVIYCRSGNRSLTASEAFLKRGHTNVMNLAGGMIDWDK